MESGRRVKPRGPRPVPMAPEDTKMTLRPSERSATISSRRRRIMTRSGFWFSSRSDLVPALTTTRRALVRKSRDMAAHLSSAPGGASIRAGDAIMAAMFARPLLALLLLLPGAPVRTGVEVLARDGFKPLQGKRV